MNTHLPNLNTYILYWLQHIKIRIVFKLCEQEEEVNVRRGSFFFFSHAIMQENRWLKSRLVTTWIIDPRDFPFTLVVWVLNFLHAKKGTLIKGVPQSKPKNLGSRCLYPTFCFHGPLYAGFGTFGGFQTPSSSSSQLSG